MFHVELRGVAERTQFFAAAAQRSRDLTPVWSLTHDRWLQEVTEQFATQGRFFGDGWAPLSPAYAKWKAQHISVPAPFGILYRTGHLLEALKSAGAGEHVYRPTATDVLLGVTGEAARIGGYHQDGTEHLPTRRVLGLRNRFKQFIFRAAVAWITGGKLPASDVSA